jgi:hypothetical protein
MFYIFIIVPHFKDTKRNNIDSFLKIGSLNVYLFIHK